MAGLLNKAKGLQASPWCVSCEHTPLRGDRPHRFQQVHWCDTCTCPLASLLCCQSFHFYSSSPPKSVKDLEPIKAREMGFTCKEITSKESPFRDAWKAKQWSSTIKQFFHIHFSSIPHFPCVLLILKWEHLWLLLYFCWPTEICFPLCFIVHSCDLTEMLGDCADFISRKMVK